MPVQLAQIGTKYDLLLLLLLCSGLLLLAYFGRNA